MAVESTSQVVRLLEEWREHLRMTHRQFAAFLGRDETEWSNLRAARQGRDYPSDTFVKAAREQVRTAGGPWLKLLDAAIQEDALAKVTV